MNFRPLSFTLSSVLIFCSLFLFTSSATAQFLPGKSSGRVPTPEKAIQFGPEMKNDSRQWSVKNLTGNKRQILAELVPPGDSLKSWKEMASQQIEFVDKPLREFVDAWKKGLAKAEPNPTLKESILADGSILVEYEAPKANEIGIRKFMKGPDAIYMIAYHVRTASKRDDIYKIWHDVVANSQLIPNPERRR